MQAVEGINACAKTVIPPGALLLHHARCRIPIGELKVEHRELECLDLLLHILTAGLAGHAEGLADVGEVPSVIVAFCSTSSWMVRTAEPPCISFLWRAQNT
jgi:hypothetical protein